jgi:hypothetical protein
MLMHIDQFNSLKQDKNWCYLSPPGQDQNNPNMEVLPNKYCNKFINNYLNKSKHCIQCEEFFPYIDPQINFKCWKCKNGF